MTELVELDKIEVPYKFDIIPLHTSDRATFKDCRRRWAWSSPAHQNLIPKVSVYGIYFPFWYGTGIHHALEHFYNPILHEDPEITFDAWYDIQWNGGEIHEYELEEFADRFPSQMKDGTWVVEGLKDVLPDPDYELFEMHHQLGLGMMRFYKEYAKNNDDFTVIASEHTFSVPVLDPSTGKPLYMYDVRPMPETWEPSDVENMYGPLMRPDHKDHKDGMLKQVHARGRMDLIVHGNTTGNYAIIDHKTADTIKEDYFDHTDLDEQCTCVPMDTQALTRTGWKFRNELSVGDEILSYDRMTETLKWSPILNITDAESPIGKFGNEQGTFSAKVTPNHRWVGRKRFSPSRHTNNWVGWESRSDEFPHSHCKVRVVANSSLNGISNITPDEAALIAWILCDGSISIHNRSLEVTISQSVSKYANEISELISRLGLKTSVRDIKPNGLSVHICKVWRFSAPEIRELFSRAQLPYNKIDDISEFIINLSKNALSSFCDVALKAEGASNKGYSKTKRLNWFCQNDGPLKESFRLAFFLNGQYATIGSKTGFGLKSDQEFDAKILKFTSIEGTHKVWCPTTKHGTWIMRQGKQITITGNTYIWAAEIEAQMYDLPYKDIAGVVYQALRKAYPSPPNITSRGLPSLDKSKESTTARLFEQCIEELGLKSYFDMDDKMQAYYTYLVEKGDKQFVQRHPVTRNRAQKDNAGLRIYMEAMDMLDNPRIYPNPTKNYSCLRCRFRGPCLAVESGRDWEDMIKDGYETNYDR